MFNDGRDKYSCQNQVVCTDPFFHDDINGKSIDESHPLLIEHQIEITAWVMGMILHISTTILF